MTSHDLTCPADGDRVPAVDGVRAVDGEWRLSVEPHAALLETITGVVPRDEPDLQELATITARLEGYVERTQRATPPSAAAAGRASDATATQPVGTGLLKRLRQLLSSLWSDSVGQYRESEPERQSAEQYDVERVYELSRFFRAALDARRAAVEVDQPTGTAAPAAD
jgi:hypothetical protein